MTDSPLDRVMPDLGPVPAAFRFATDASYANLRRLIATADGFARYSVRTFRSAVHDHIWGVARDLLTELPDCYFVEEVGTEVLRYRDKYVIQTHKVDERLCISPNDTFRPLEIQGQGHLWQVGAAPVDGDIWLTIGHEPDSFTHLPKRVILGVAIEGGMTEYRNIEPDPDVVASIGPMAADTVRRIMGT